MSPGWVWGLAHAEGGCLVAVVESCGTVWAAKIVWGLFLWGEEGMDLPALLVFLLRGAVDVVQVLFLHAADVVLEVGGGTASFRFLVGWRSTLGMTFLPGSKTVTSQPDLGTGSIRPRKVPFKAAVSYSKVMAFMGQVS